MKTRPAHDKLHSSTKVHTILFHSPQHVSTFHICFKYEYTVHMYACLHACIQIEHNRHNRLQGKITLHYTASHKITQNPHSNIA